MAGKKSGKASSGVCRTPKKLRQDNLEGKSCIVVIMEGSRHYVLNPTHETFSSRKAEARFFSGKELETTLFRVKSTYHYCKVFTEKWEERVLTKTPELTGSGGQETMSNMSALSIVF